MLRWSRSPERLPRWHLVVLAAIAFVPALASSPGRMPADTKLFLYLDPAGLTSDALSTWDSGQFAGWVPHQTVSYLWPSGPWYTVMDWLGAPDWIAQRLWLGTLLFAGAAGVRWAASHLGLAATGALVAGIVYQLSPYVLPYVSRTSAMLLPWAGLGWLIGVTVRVAMHARWRDVAVFGLIVGTVAAPNATAIAMVAPGPLLWIVAATWTRRISVRRAVRTVTVLGGVAILVSLWWISMLAVQARFGADVLGYSESLEAVSLTASAPETWRGMGYWLFYIRDPIGFATTASYEYMASAPLIAVSFALTLLSVGGLVWTHWRERAFSISLVVVGMVLAVGAHPIDDPPPLFSAVATNSRSGIALALRSSTRALPLSTLGLALGIGALVTACAARTRTRRSTQRRRAMSGALPIAVIALVALNAPAVRHAALVDPTLSRDQSPPQAWLDAAGELDTTNAGARVLLLPGAEFGAYRWGYTVDPPLAGLTDKPLLTRDLLPLGSPGAMDLLEAFDDRFQQGIAEPSSIAPIARLLGVDTIWQANDSAFERFRTPPPRTIDDILDAAADVGDAALFGDDQPNTPVIAMIDERSIADPTLDDERPPVALRTIDDAVPIVRAKVDTVVVAGSGDGLIDAAAAGLIDGTELLRALADLDDAELADLWSSPGGVGRVVITDSNRLRAHHWRSSQDVTGFTEDVNGGVLRLDSADQRLPVFPDATDADHTVAEQRGPVTIRASAYGEPFAYRPENRAAAAIDGDDATAWMVGAGADPTGEYVELRMDRPISKLNLRQPANADRWIDAVTVTTDTSGPRRYQLGDPSRDDVSGDRVVLDASASEITIEIDSVVDRSDSESGLDPVGFSEIETGLGPTVEVVRAPTRIGVVPPDTPLDIVLSRLRVRATDRWRDDPEASLVRAVTVPGARSFDIAVTARVDQRADDAALAALFDWSGTIANARLTGVPEAGGWAATDGEVDSAWITPFDGALGATLTIPLDGRRAIGQLRLRQPDRDDLSRITEVAISGGGAARVVAVTALDDTLRFDPLTTDSLTITITATDRATTRERRDAQLVELPAAISEVGGDGIVSASFPARLAEACHDDLLRIDGDPVPLRLSGSREALFTGAPITAAPCGPGQPLTRVLDAGEHLVVGDAGARGAIAIDRVVMRSGATTDSSQPVLDAAVIDQSRDGRSVRVDACPLGCWLVFGEGFNRGWTASTDGEDLGVGQPVDGGFNGWWLPPSDQTRTVELHWAGQRTLRAGLAVSAVAVLGCLVAAIIDRRRRVTVDASMPTWTSPWRRRSIGRASLRSVVTVAVVGALGWLVVAPRWGLLGAGIVILTHVVLRRPRLCGVGALALLAFAAAVMVRRVTLYQPLADAGWPAHFADLHRPTMFAVVLLAASAISGSPRPDATQASTPRRDRSRR